MPRRAAATLAILAVLAAAPVFAQPVTETPDATGPVAVVDQERLFTESAFGLRVFDEIDRRSAALAAENRRIETELIAEERALTEARDTLSAEEFQKRAVAFDRKVQQLRNAQDAKVRAVSQFQDQARQDFFAQSAPILSRLLSERGASVLLDRRQILLSRGDIDVTDTAIRRIDAVLGDGSGKAADEAPDTAD